MSGRDEYTIPADELRPKTSQDSEPEVHTVQIPMCDLCLDGAGGECHTPGCIFWINRAPDLPIRSDPRLLFVRPFQQDADK